MKSSAVSLILTVFLLWLTIQIELSFEEYFAYFFVLTIGILHGANDISLINYVFKDKSKSKLKYLGYYILIILVTALSFFIMPFFALVVFVIFSCYHFGEQHFNGQLQSQNYSSKILYLSYGILIFGLLFYCNAADTSLIILELTSVNISEVHYQYFLLSGLVLSVFFCYLSLKNFEKTPNYFEEIFLILLFALIFKLASILWAFSIYFIIWHSLPSLKDQVTTLHGKFSKKSLVKYVKSSVLNWSISIVGLVLMYYTSQYFQIRFITLFFAFLAAITIPHVIVMYHLNKK